MPDTIAQWRSDVEDQITNMVDAEGITPEIDGALRDRLAVLVDARLLSGGDTRGATLVTGTKDNYAMGFITNNLRRMTLTASGRLLKGTETESIYDVDINGSFRANGVMLASNGVGYTRSIIGDFETDIYLPTTISGTPAHARFRPSVSGGNPVMTLQMFKQGFFTSDFVFAANMLTVPGLTVTNNITAGSYTTKFMSYITTVASDPLYNAYTRSGISELAIVGFAPSSDRYQIRVASSNPTFSAGIEALSILRANGKTGINQPAPTSQMHINGANGYTQLRLQQSYTPSSSADSNGAEGDVAWDVSYVYVKTSAGWKRTALSAF